MINKIIAALATFLLFSPLYSQYGADYFSDRFVGGQLNLASVCQNEGEFIYVGGSAFDSANFQGVASITKLDTSGKTIWSFSLHRELQRTISDNFRIHEEIGVVSKIVIDKNAVYAYRSGREYNEIWKLDKTTGNLVWKKPTIAIRHLININDSCLGISLEKQNVLGYQAISKNTGRVLTEATLQTPYTYTDNVLIESDGQGSVFLAEGHKLTKFNNFRLSQIDWTTTMPAGVITGISRQNDGYVYIFGNEAKVSNPIYIAQLSAVDGTSRWLTLTPSHINYDHRINNVKFTANDIYFTTSHMFYGSVSTGYHVWRMNRHTGDFAWKLLFMA